uniref:protein-tyrosine-phosphatase n=2 Tax=Lepeophtheirus salmonis TaxID=72036 RepID=A0A0K2UFV7_LEPSM
MIHLGKGPFLLVIYFLNLGECADLVIRIPTDLSQQDGFYRLNYHPNTGYPAANTTFRPSDISEVIEFSKGLPGTKYDFQLYYSNSTIEDWLSWTASITTVPDPPSNLSINVVSGKIALIDWDPPVIGGHSGFKLKVIPLSEPLKSVRSIFIRQNSSPFQLRDLTSGATYEVQLFTVYENKDSTVYISTNFTTTPNTPGRFIVWFRNETTLLVLWQPPYPAGVYTDYKVSIDPSDAEISETYVPKEGEPPGPAQAAFNGLIPGRAYNISVETVSESKISEPTTAQYRTVPWRPHNVTFDLDSIEPYSFRVRWSAPRELTEFDRYQVAIGIRRKTPQIVDREKRPLEAKFVENLKPGHTYQVVVKTVSGSVASWPATGNVTTRPLPVGNVRTISDSSGRESQIVWEPNPDSHQDSYKITYHELETFNGDSSSIEVGETSFSLDGNLQPGRNYSISIQAVSKGIASEQRILHQATRPASPIIEDVEPISYGLNISWKSDVTSQQERYAVVYTRNDTGESTTIETREPKITLANLYPGAGYEIQVYAVSHNMRSEPHNLFTAVYPNPPRNLTLALTENNIILLSWLKPENSIFTNFIIKYRAYGNDYHKKWNIIDEIKDTQYELKDLTPGQKFEIVVDSVSHRVESRNPLVIRQTIPPESIFDIIPTLDAENITLTWVKPYGHNDFYHVKWHPLSNPEDIRENKIDANPNQVPGTNFSVMITGLHPGVEYNFEVSTESHSLHSNIKNISVRTKPLITSELNILNKKDLTTSLTLLYTETPLTKSLFDTYRFLLGNETKEKAALDLDRRLSFSNLTPGRLENITFWTVSGGVLSSPLIEQERLHPEQISNLNASRITDTDIILSWTEPRGDHDLFEVQYLNVKSRLVKSVTKDNFIEVNNLRPFKNYTFSVVTKAGDDETIPRRSKPVSQMFSTKESVPGSPEVFEPYQVLPSAISFKWDLPVYEENGIITGFIILYGIAMSESDEFYQTESVEFDPNYRTGTITNLVPGEVYTFQIQAKTRIGLGEPKRYEQKMPILAPPTPNRKIKPELVSKSTQTIVIRYAQNYFSNENGGVNAYSIILAEDYTKPTESKLTLLKWQDVQSYRSWPPYQVTERYFPFHNKSTERFTIGVEDCKDKVGYCNGPLKPGSTYRYKIRAYTAPDKFSETTWSDEVKTDPDNTAFLVGIIIPIIILILFIIFILILRRLKYYRGGSGCFKRRNPDRDMRHNDNISLPDSVMETSKPVKCKDFAEHYRIMSADSDFRFSEEYEELKHVGREKSCAAADLPINRPKNRFTNILPYDHSRVKLQPTDDEEGTDYINANFIPGFNSPREYVVTQGCLHSTRDDFWRMCWETNSRAIVMLTRCIEKGREKCDHYWPYDTQPVYYGDIQVTILNESHFQDWNVSEFRMMRGDTVRSIKHFHFTTWPDFGVPDPPQTLVRFVRAFRERISPEQRPIVVHCSAGVGRSGTFIALDRILQVIRHSDVVDIFGIVYEMRKERVWMVQTEQQYICIHQCLLTVLEGKENDPAIHEIHDNEGFEDDEGIVASGM